MLHVSEIVYFSEVDADTDTNDTALLKIDRETAQLRVLKLAKPALILVKTSPKDDEIKFGYTLGIVVSCVDYPQFEGVITTAPVIEGEIIADEEVYPFGQALANELKPAVILVRRSDFSEGDFRLLKAQCLEVLATGEPTAATEIG